MLVKKSYNSKEQQSWQHAKSVTAKVLQNVRNAMVQEEWAVGYLHHPITSVQQL
jgi:hypothetical protein